MKLLSIILTVFAISFGIVRKGSKLASQLLLLLLFILITFEFTNVGEGDYAVYEQIYEAIGGQNEWVFVSYEPLFILFLSVCNKFGLGLVAVKGIMAVIVLSLLYKTIKTYTNNVAFVLSLFFIFPALFDAELMRWLLAESVVIYGFKYLIRGDGIKDYVKYFLFVIIASLFHIGASVFVLFLLSAIKNKRFLYFFVAIMSLFALIAKSVTPLYSILSNLPFGDNLQEKYQTGYVANTNGAIFAIFRYLEVFAIAFVANNLMGNLKIHEKNEIVSSMGEKLCSAIMTINVIMIMFIPLNLFSAQVQRMYHAVLILNYIFLAIKCEKKKSFSFGAMAGVLCSLLCLVVGFHMSEGTEVIFNSHFTVGYLIRMTHLLGM